MSFSKPKKEKHLSQRVDKELHYKLHYISKYYGRSANGEVIYLIRKAIEAFEAEHGKIEPPAGAE
jgi:predicted DNA-binding protein